MKKEEDQTGFILKGSVDGPDFSTGPYRQSGLDVDDPGLGSFRTAVR